MGVVSYVFRGPRAVAHPSLDGRRPAAGRPSGQAEGGRAEILKGLTSQTQPASAPGGHRPQRGKPKVGDGQGHWHELTIEGTGKDAIYTLGAPKGCCGARARLWQTGV